MKITIHADPPYRNEDYTVELDRKMDEYVPGDLICYTCPFFGMPLVLEIAIRADGSIGFRSWSWDTSRGNAYLHTSETADKNSFFCFKPTEQQIDTVNGLFSGRIKWDGLKLAPGATLQAICPINVEREEQLIEKKDLSQPAITKNPPTELPAGGFLFLTIRKFVFLSGSEVSRKPFILHAHKFASFSTL